MASSPPPKKKRQPEKLWGEIVLPNVSTDAFHFCQGTIDGFFGRRLVMSQLDQEVLPMGVSMNDCCNTMIFHGVT